MAYGTRKTDLLGGGLVIAAFPGVLAGLWLPSAWLLAYGVIAFFTGLFVVTAGRVR